MPKVISGPDILQQLEEGWEGEEIEAEGGEEVRLRPPGWLVTELWLSSLDILSVRLVFLLPALSSRIPNIFLYQFLPTPTLCGPFCDTGAHFLPAGQLGAKAFTLYRVTAYSVNLGCSSFIFLSGELKRRFFFLFASTLQPHHSIISFDKKAK